MVHFKADPDPNPNPYPNSNPNPNPNPNPSSNQVGFPSELAARLALRAELEALQLQHELAALGRLQPYVLGDATPCARGCNPMC